MAVARPSFRAGAEVIDMLTVIASTPLEKTVIKRSIKICCISHVSTVFVAFLVGGYDGSRGRGVFRSMASILNFLLSTGALLKLLYEERV